MTKEDSSEARKRTALATSSGLPNRQRTWAAAPPLRISSLTSGESAIPARASSTISVSVKPGQTQFTRMLSRPWRTANALVSCKTAPLEAT